MKLIFTQASNFPEFEGGVDWSYDKIDISADAFAGEDPELEAFAGEIRDGLRAELAARAGSAVAWEESTLSVVRSVPWICLLYTSPSPRDRQKSRMPSSA